MNKVCKKWQVFLIVLCMLFTMTPATVFADDSTDLPIVNQQMQSDESDKGDQTGDDESDKGDQTGDDESDKGDQTGDATTPGDGLNPTESEIELMRTMTGGTGCITVKKDITGMIPDSDATFNFTLTGPNGYSNNFDIVGEKSIKFENLVYGTYTIMENCVPENYTAKSNGSTRTLSHCDKNQTLTFENEYTKPTTLTIHKDIIGNPGSPSEFTFAVEERHYKHYWPFEEYYTPVSTVTILGEGTQQIDVDGGCYRITEINIPQYYSVEDDQKERNINHGENKEVTFTNTYSGPTTGSLKIEKNVRGEDEVPVTVFDFRVTGPNDYSKMVSVTGGAFVILEDLESGDYTVTEGYTEDFYPVDNDYDQTETIAAGAETTVEFTNYYDPGEPAVSVTKEVALYDGVIPESGFVKNLTLTELNKQVIYRISYRYNDAWERINGDLSLSDLYDRNGTISDITSNLKIWSGGELVTPQGINADEIYYYIDTLPTIGTYNNTAYLLEPLYRTLVEEGDNEYEQGVIASSSAVVVVNYTPPNNNNGGGGGGGGSHTHTYDVTYNANYPTGGGISGEVPKDTNDYSYNTTVSVKGNTGDLKAGTYSFEGWNTKADGTGTMYLPGSTFKISEDTILYAQWKLVGEPAAAAADPNAGTDDGSAVTAETAQAAGLDDVPKTGTGAPLLPMFLLGLLSLAGITLCRKKVID